jgi:predicted nuclease with RNAse H fold
VLKLKSKVIIGIDLAGKAKNPTGIAILKDSQIETRLVYTDEEILEAVNAAKPSIVAIDAPLKLPKKGILRKGDLELVKKGYRVFPPGLPAMKTLTRRAIRLDKLIKKSRIETVEVHPTSTRKALGMPTKNWKEIQEIFKKLGLDGTLEERSLTRHELDAITAALTAYLHLQGLTESIGDDKEGWIIVPKKIRWQELRI